MLLCHPVFVIAALCWPGIFATPHVTFPLNAQLPPAAVADERYSFAFSQDTFSSNLAITYTLGTAPKWLQLDNTRNILFGMPSSSDIGNIHFQLGATDGTGNASLDATLVVLDKNDIQPNNDIFLRRISQLGKFSAPATLLLYPQTPFRLDFGLEVFRGSSNNTHYYAVSASNTPLPAWVTFDAETVTFSGTTPSLLAPQSSPQTYTFELAASDTPGFSQASVTFQLSVTNHVLTFQDPVKQFNVSAGAEVEIPSLLDQLYRDGAVIDRSKVVKISANPPAWLAFDSADLSFAGIAPSNPVDTDFRMTVNDDENNSCTIEIQLAVSGPSYSGLETIFLGEVNAIRGAYFKYSFSDYNTAESWSSASINISAAPWLSFTQANLTIQGIVPTTEKETVVNVTLTVSRDGRTNRTEILTILTGYDNSLMPSSSSTDGASAVAPAPSSTASGPRHAPNKSPKTQTRALAVKIVVPLIGVMVLSVLFLMFRSSSKKRHQSPVVARTSPNIRPSETTASLAQMCMPEESQSLSGTTTTTATTTRMHLPSSPPPRVDLPWQVHQSPLNKRPPAGDEAETESPETRSSWEDMLMEVESPVAYGMALMPGRHGSESRKTAFGRSPVSPRDSKPVLQKMTCIDTLPSKPQRPRSPVVASFNGRRSHGLGHGTNVRGSGVGVHRMTLRQVSLSPLSASSRMSKNVQEHHQATRSSPVLRRSRNFGTMRTTGTSRRSPDSHSTKRISVAGGSSRYDAPLSENESDKLSLSGPYIHQSQSDSYDPFSEPAMEDQNVTRERSATRLSGWYSRNLTGGGTQTWDDISSEHRAALQGLYVSSRAVPTAASMSSQASRQSQGNSLRFI